jgi:hypothetical protein
MSQRGRGLLEIHPSKNPFYQTTASDIGRNIDERVKVDWNRPRDFSPASSFTTSGQMAMTSDDPSPATEQAPKKDFGEDFSFLYARSSDVIGGKLPKQMGTMAACMDSNPHKARSTMGSTVAAAPPQQRIHVKKDVNAILEVYKHEPKMENPLYATAMNEYGRKKPSVATFVADRRGRPQEFSNSFNGIKPKNSSLNTSLSKSTVHAKLDPQFM